MNKCIRKIMCTVLLVAPTFLQAYLPPSTPQLTQQALEAAAKRVAGQKELAPQEMLAMTLELVHAIKRCDNRVVKILVSAMPELVHAKNSKALVYAAIFGDAVMIKTLLDAGADINSIDPETGMTALELASRRGKPAVINCLQKHIRSKTREEEQQRALDKNFLLALELDTVAAIQAAINRAATEGLAQYTTPSIDEEERELEIRTLSREVDAALKTNKDLIESWMLRIKD